MSRGIGNGCGQRRGGVWLLVILAVGSALAQNAPAERRFQASRTQVEKALQDMHAELSGRLPILEGFVVPGDRPLEKYRRGYYQYVVSVKDGGTNQVSVQVQAKITAWYADDNTSKAGYRVLVSNGRLESDLLDRLQEQLPQAAAADAGPVTTEAKRPSAGASEPATAKIRGNIAALNSQTAARLPSRAESSAIAKEQSDEHLQELLREEKSLEEILQNQARPNNLVAIKKNQTPVYARPVETSKVLFLADAEDEFQEVEESGLWVHVQVSGIARGWIQRSQVELPGDAVAGSPVDEKSGDKVLFRQTREETAVFPGDWEPLRGKQVKIVWVQPSGMEKTDQDSRRNFAKRIFRTQYPELTKILPSVAGLVVVFDSQDGGMAAATLATLQQWQAGHLTDDAFWKRCWLDPADAFKEQ